MVGGFLVSIPETSVPCDERVRGYPIRVAVTPTDLGRGLVSRRLAGRERAARVDVRRPIMQLIG